MATNVRQTLMFRFFIFFIVVTVLSLVLADWLNANKINNLVVIGANCLLLVLAGISTQLQVKAAANPNPNVFVRSVMGGTFLKLMIILISLVIYLVAAGKNKSIYAIFVGMGLYIVYTVIEIKGLMELNKPKNGN